MVQIDYGRGYVGKAVVPNAIKANGRILEYSDGEVQEALPVNADDNQICIEYGYPKGARAKFRSKLTGIVTTFCNIE